ncbi:uncharacterized protein [Chironomus tepperi]|uniref:uncharacterized protein n=1 Tax=Chironomus tepperi TaxID=113505 RepID=UPI00391F8532
MCLVGFRKLLYRIYYKIKISSLLTVVLFYVRLLCEVQASNITVEFIEDNLWNCSDIDKSNITTPCGQYEYLKSIIRETIFIIIIVTGVIFLLCFISVAIMIRTKYRRNREGLFLHNVGVGPHNVEVATIT